MRDDPTREYGGMLERVTIGDVAERAGVSIATVSRVVNGRYGVAPATLSRVKAVIADLGYESSLIARSLRSQRTNVIGVLVTDIEPFSAEVLKGAANALRGGEYELVVYSGGHGGDQVGWERRYMSRLSGTLTDGTVLVTPTVSEVPTSQPVVAVDPQTGVSSFPTFASQNLEGALSATRHLVELGHRRIGFLGGRRDLESARLHEQGYRQGLEEAGIAFDPDLVLVGGFKESTAVAPARQLLSLPDRPTAVFAANDSSAIQTMRTTGELGLEIPRELSVIGFDNVPESALTHPPLTTVDQFIQALGYEAVRLLITLIEHPDQLTVAPRKVALPTELVVRGSPRHPGRHRRDDRVRRIEIDFSPMTSVPPPTRFHFTSNQIQGEAMRIRTRHGRRLFAALASLAFVAAACGDDDGGAADTTTTGTEAPATSAATSGEAVEIDWWHIQNNPPGSDDWQAMADAFMAEHPNVKIKITAMANEAFKAAIQTNIQSGEIPDLFQSWGGGGLRDQVAAGVVRDVTAESAGFVGDLGEGAVKLYQVDGKQYGIPYNAGMVGFWYNKDLFAEAGIDAPPTTWDELLADIQALKDAGITPVAVGAGDKWPAHFWYSYLMVRLGDAEAMNQIAADNNFSVPNVIGAGEKVAELVALEPFQEGFLGAGWDAPDGESGTMASGGAAMDLMGQWAPGAFKNQAGLEPTEDLPFELGWFPFPSVDGGAGQPSDVFGGADGFAVGKDAPPEAVEFLAFITNPENQRTWAKNSGLPVNKAAKDAVTDPNMLAVLDGLNSASFMQLYLDQYFTAEVGGTVNDQTALLFAGATSPEDAADAITAVAGG